MIKKIILIGLIFLPLTSFAQKVWTLEQCVDTAWNNNLKIRQQQNTLRTAKSITGRQAQPFAQSQRIGRSKLCIRTFANGGQHLCQFQLEANFVEPVEQRNTVRRTTNEVQHRCPKGRLDGIQSRFGKDTKRHRPECGHGIHAGVAQQRAAANCQRSTGADQTKIEQRQALVSNGKMAEGEMYELQAQAAKEELSRTQNENALKLSLLDLAQIMEIDNFEQLDVVVPENLIDKNAMIISAQTIYESAITHRPEIKAPNTIY